MKKLSNLQFYTLLAGTIFAFATVVIDFVRFYGYEGTLLKLSDCVVPNPVLTPCFYGAFAFLLALFWANQVRNMSGEKQVKKQKNLFHLLIAGNIFAWSNFLYIVYKFFKAKGQAFVGCSGVITENPLTTPCFLGSLFFLLALLVGYNYYLSLKD